MPFEHQLSFCWWIEVLILLPYSGLENGKVTRQLRDTWRILFSKKELENDESLLKAELLTLARQHFPSFKKNVVDEITKARGMEVLRLPPYNCELNSIELIWAQGKGNVARENTTFQLADVKKLLQAAVAGRYVVERRLLVYPVHDRHGPDEEEISVATVGVHVQFALERVQDFAFFGLLGVDQLGSDAGADDVALPHVAHTEHEAEVAFS
ncbi:hypothetical protein NQ317_001123 [Molorchus minor]|uniref:Transposase n=1 Tax=Molorchus minor TaxID=1323400 RepID=A0ABQ9JIL7_9CUCU|nr:hypothetical protein NQ317_001123 [Molorchus minor]